MAKSYLLRIRALKTNFYTYQGVVKALDGIDLDMEKGEILGLVGETGCGKSVTALSILRLIPSPPGKIESGEALFDVDEEAVEKIETLRSEVAKTIRDLFGAKSVYVDVPVTAALLYSVMEAVDASAAVEASRKQRVLARMKELRDLLVTYDLLSKDENELMEIRGNNISMIFQEPMQALNPVFTIGDQIAESIVLHRPKTLYRRIVLRMRSEVIRKRTMRAIKERFESRTDLPAGVDLDDPTRADLEMVLKALSKGAAKDDAVLTDLRELIRLERAAGAEHSRRTIFSRGLPKSVQERRYQRKWLTSGWKPTEVGKELVSIYSSSGDGGSLPWRGAQAVDGGVLALTPASELSPEGLAKELTKTLRNSRTSSSSESILAKVLEDPKVEDSRVLLAIRKPYQKPAGKGADRFLLRVPLLRRALNYPLKRQSLDEAAEMLRLLKIPDPERVILEYPYELSGGMQQRALIAIALSCDPLLLIADEPTTALDVTIQAQILELLRELKRAGRPSILIITHDLGVIADMCNRVCVMYGGVIVENAPVREIFKDPKHPYTQGLLKAIPSHAEKRERLEVIKGSVPNLIYPPGGCRFHPRCPMAMPHCGWDSRDLENLVRGYLEEFQIVGEKLVTYNSESPQVLKVTFVAGDIADKAAKGLLEKMEAAKGASVLLKAVTGMKREGNDLVFNLLEPRKPAYQEITSGHYVACYLYEPMPEVSVHG